MEIQAKRDWGSSDRPDLVHACLTLLAYIVLKIYVFSGSFLLFYHLSFEVNQLRL